jgi:hypothetical protein
VTSNDYVMSHSQISKSTDAGSYTGMNGTEGINILTNKSVVN